MSEQDGPPPAMVNFLFERVRVLEAKVKELEAWKAQAMAWAESQREYHADNANEAGQFFDVFGVE